MSVIWLQVSAVSLLVCWVMILLAMGKLKPVRSNSPLAEAKTDTVIHDQPEQTVQLTGVPEYTFAGWEGLWAKEEESCRVVIENPLWDQASEAYGNFKEQCAQKNISIVNRNDSSWLDGQSVVHFDDCTLMPYLWEQNYSIHLVEGKSLLNLLKEASPFSMIIISVKDDGSQALSHDWQEKLADCGIRSLTREYLRYSYINIIWKKYESLYVSLYEECSEGPLSKQYSEGDFVNEFKFPVHLEVASGGLNSGNRSSIKINGREYSPNLRGMNIAVYDVIDSKVEGVHRVDTFMTMYEDTTIYRARPIEGENYAS
ncbi:interleukin-like EMT inducer domain-containing protein [Cohnella cholangitidis]|uniref:Uncharacterized protein n=1 Tax=Cohnella cholangitidis TaxID=2598458 RepID=A0A7G5BYA8_9BACL|nr:interleukin-like EMT inducer domain-containing protein [Cohnella cholangitidis]QMV41942.1 hypothetical protein FPL14_12640 [Cohnella cholangitidis]